LANYLERMACRVETGGGSKLVRRPVVVVPTLEALSGDVPDDGRAADAERIATSFTSSPSVYTARS
jgi:hypothetical protein